MTEPVSSSRFATCDASFAVPLHLTAGAQFLPHAWCCADAAGRCATDGAAGVLPRGRTRRRAVAPLNRSAAENAAIPAFPDRTIASHQSTRVMAVVCRVWRVPEPQRSAGAGRTQSLAHSAVKLAAPLTVPAGGARPR